MERLVHLPFVHTSYLRPTLCLFSLSLSLSLSPSPSELRPLATFRLAPFSPLLLSGCFSFRWTNQATPGGVFYASWTPGLAGRQSQLRSCFKVGARTKYGSISSYKYFCFFLPDTTPPTSRVAFRIPWKLSLRIARDAIFQSNETCDRVVNFTFHVDIFFHFRRGWLKDRDNYHRGFV